MRDAIRSTSAVRFSRSARDVRTSWRASNASVASWRAAARESGRTLDLPDALIAATAFDLDAAVLTRNVQDFALTPVRIETY